MAVYSGSIDVKYCYERISDSYRYCPSSPQPLNYNSSSTQSASNRLTNTDFDYDTFSISNFSFRKDGISQSVTDVPVIISVSGGATGGFLIPAGIQTGSNPNISFGYMTLYGPNVYIDAIVFGPDDDLPVDISENGLYYKDNDGNWHDVTDKSIVATAQQVSNLPSGVDFNGWLVDDEIIEGSDGNYYDTDGNLMFSNLPSGVIPVSTIIPPSSSGSSGGISEGVFEGSDGNYYNDLGDQVLEDLPSGVTPVSALGEAVLGSDGVYYKLDGSEAFENLPSGVTITSYDSSTGEYIGSDGQSYDIDGNPGTSPCVGDLLTYNNTVRLSIDAEDIFGNQVNIGGDIQIGTPSIQLPSATIIRKINRVVVRNISSGSSCGNGNLNIKGDVVGAKIGLDWEVYDIDLVLGTYDVCNCVFTTCNKYADIVYNSDLPLGFAQLTNVDVGYYCLSDHLTLNWEGFSSSEFPYCCGHYDDSVVEGGALGKDNNKLDVDTDLQCVCDNLEQIHLTLSDKLDLIAEKIEDGLSCICDKLDSLVSAVQDKELSVTVEGDDITVEPADVTVTNPVNNITVSPCQPIVTNPVNNITVQSAVPDITVSPCQPTVQNVINEGDCINDNTDLIQCLEGLFKKESDTITDILDDTLKTTYQDAGGNVVTDGLADVIRKKEDTNVFECIVEPVNMAYEGYGKYVSKDVLDDGNA